MSRLVRITCTSRRQIKPDCIFLQVQQPAVLVLGAACGRGVRPGGALRPRPLQRLALDPCGRAVQRAHLRVHALPQLLLLRRRAAPRRIDKGRRTTPKHGRNAMTVSHKNAAKNNKKTTSCLLLPTPRILNS